jgi:predicted TPR repeat methyltransferase
VDTSGSVDVATFVRRATALRTADEARELYDAWAPSYDDHDVSEAMGYAPPERMAERVAGLVPSDADVLDAGCGTGLVGVALADRGFRSVDGLDLSPGMVARARKRRAYHDLGPADLTARLPGASDKFTVLTCAGALQPGHLGPSALTEFVRVVVRGGYILATVGEREWTDSDYEANVARLAAHGLARVLDESDRPLDGAPGYLLVLEVQRASSAE